MTNPLKKQQLYNEKNGERPRAQINSMDRRQGYTHTLTKKYTFMCLLLSRVEPRADKGLQSQHARILSVHP